MGRLLTLKQQRAVGKDHTASIQSLLARVWDMNTVLDGGVDTTLKRIGDGSQCIPYNPVRVAAQQGMYAQHSKQQVGKSRVKVFGYLEVKLASGRVWEYAHRLVLWAFDGPPTAQYPEAMHTCNNKMCLNISHLHWGSHEENMGEMYARVRRSRAALLVSGPRVPRLELVKPAERKKKGG
jgi:hypothetical protein